MTPTYLRFGSRADALEAFRQLLGLAVVPDAIPPIVLSGADQVQVDVLFGSGVVYKDGAPVPGFHVNLLTTGGIALPSVLEAARITPKSPTCGWAF
ncbi:hypothetical protein [Caulobacter sp. FWC2]|uniref:hypothetical protein n=1 Tax=Caulobacter sp. FWC2 TaxID=69664 RepID=UPI000C155DFC|nr:hypothetical protein [Caulobacter sp. FWC2]PIB91302.1 hypothetical protein CSW62_06755 [Caulobacter sp. FWC2]